MMFNCQLGRFFWTEKEAVTAAAEKEKKEKNRIRNMIKSDSEQVFVKSLEASSLIS